MLSCLAKYLNIYFSGLIFYITGSNSSQQNRIDQARRASLCQTGREILKKHIRTRFICLSLFLKVVFYNQIVESDGTFCDICCLCVYVYYTHTHTPVRSNECSDGNEAHV